MNDITELAQSLKAAAEKATPGQWMAFTHADSQTFSVHTPDDKRCGDVIKWAGFDGQRKAKANAEFIALANPSNILALVEALEKAQETIAFQQGEIKALLSSLESRTVKLPKPISVLHRREFTAAHCAIYAYPEAEVNAALASAGIKVEAE